MGHWRPGPALGYPRRDASETVLRLDAGRPRVIDPTLIIDLRSDTVTLPSAPMREVMAAAPVGNDEYGEDPTVNRLQDRTAALLGKEAGLWLPSWIGSRVIRAVTHLDVSRKQCEEAAEILVDIAES
jgi:hypothetical protein